MVRARLQGINTVRKRLADGTVRLYYYHRATALPLSGKPGSPEFIRDYGAAEKTLQPMDDTNSDDESKKPITEQLAELVGAAASTLAESAVKSVAKRVTKAAGDKTPRPVKKAAKVAAKAIKAPKKTDKKAEMVRSFRPIA